MIHDRLIDIVQHDIHYKAHIAGEEVITVREFKFCYKKNTSLYQSDYFKSGMKKFINGEMDLLSIYPERKEYELYEIKTTKTKKAMTKAKKQVGIDNGLINYIKTHKGVITELDDIINDEYKCAGKNVVYNRTEGAKLTDTYYKHKYK